jgi:sugar phosphate isomerase/epimerase
VELGLTPDTRWKTDMAALVEVAGTAGFKALGTTSLLVTPDAPRLYASAGLLCHELLGLVVTDVDTTLGWAAQVAEQAARVRARWVNTTFKTVDDGTAGLVRRCAAMFAEAGAGMAIEFSPLGPVASLQDGLDMVDVSGNAATGVVVDIWNVHYGPTTWAELERTPPERISYVQFNDALPQVGDPDVEALNRRTYPGQGVFDVERFVAVLRGTGWDGVVSVQILSEQLRQLPLAEFARRAYETSSAYWV